MFKKKHAPCIKERVFLCKKEFYFEMKDNFFYNFGDDTILIKGLN